MPESSRKAYCLINIGLAYRELAIHLKDVDNDLSGAAYKSLLEAAGTASRLGDFRTASYARGYLGTLEEDKKHYQKALEWTRAAVFAAQRVNAPESSFRWHWQAGRLLKALGDQAGALSAYRQSIDSVHAIRQEMAHCYAHPGTSFRRAAGSLFSEFVDLLLRRAAALEQEKEVEPLLYEARETLELLKVFELREYFKDDCVDAARSAPTSLDVVSQTAIVLYPVSAPGPDRTARQSAGGFEEVLGCCPCRQGGKGNHGLSEKTGETHHLGVSAACPAAL